MNLLQCEKCGQSLALADSQCSACRTPVPPAQRLALLLPRAEGLAEEERYFEAARALEPALGLALAPEDAKGLWRKKGVWLRKASVLQPQYLDAAEAALTEALHLDDNDDLSHQIWIDLLVQRGSADKARAWYQQRLEKNPEDSVAKRQMAVLKLAADFKAQPRPQSALELDTDPDNFLWRMVVPTPWKTWSMGVTGAISLVVALNLFLSHTSGVPAVAVPPVDPDLASAMAANPAQLLAGLNDPWMWSYNALGSAAYVYWAYGRRKKPKRG